jgi:predicted RNA binding protein YcfA (HicA-like mRNA interferase family)
LTRLPVVSGRDAVRAFSRIGYVLDHQTGSHMILRNQHPPHRRLTAPDHKELAKGTLRSLIRLAATMFAVAHPVLAQSNDGYVLKKSTIDGGGHAIHEGGGYRLGGTIGQHDAGDHAGGGYVLTGGFWTPAALPPGPTPGACCDHDPRGGCQDDRTLDECVCGTCEWFQERTCAQVDCTREAIPTVSEWGLAVLTLLLMIGAKICFGRPNVAGP